MRIRYAHQGIRRATLALLAALAVSAGVTPGCASRGQRYEHFRLTTPIEPGQTLVIGILGGRNKYDNPERGVTWVAEAIRARNLPGVHVETLENARLWLGRELIRNALDRNGNGWLEWEERRDARIILYGQSFGGAAVVRLARDLDRLGIPVLLTVQIDSVGRNDALIPANVRAAANLYQSSGWVLRGEPRIRAADPARTCILGNFPYDYSRGSRKEKNIDISRVHFLKRFFNLAHTRMGFDLEVWDQVEQIIMDTLHGAQRAACPPPSETPPVKR